MSVLLLPPERYLLRQLFNDTENDQLWLVVGAPPEAANTLQTTQEELEWLYPDGPRRFRPSDRPSIPTE